MSVVDSIDWSDRALALDRRRALQLAGLTAGGLAAYSLVPSLTRLPFDQLVRSTSFGDIRVLSAVRSAVALPGSLPPRADTFGDAVTVGLRLRNATGAAQWLPPGQFRARLLGGPAVTAYDASTRSLELAAGATAELSVGFLVPGDGRIAYLEFTEPGAIAPIILGVPTVTGRQPRPVADHRSTGHGG